MKVYLIIILVLFSMLNLSCTIKNGIAENAQESNEYVELSIDFLDALQEGKSTISYKSKLQNTTINELSASLKTNAERTAFWINIYNAYIQDVLKEHPELYDDRGAFFRKNRIDILGRKFSFGEIEHGIIRRSQNEFGLGYVRKWFPPSWERKLRVFERDYRIHFALNCGAKDCPPVAKYNSLSINDQLNKSTKMHLEKTSKFLHNKDEVEITSLFSWFRGDFGGKSGTIEILKKYNIVPDTSFPSLNYTEYDWTLYLDNYIELE